MKKKVIKKYHLKKEIKEELQNELYNIIGIACAVIIPTILYILIF